ncbi:MAG TPA: XRE family transcriptional regulator [Cyanobacteria bacterium UBA11369]|nr:XRE family transcriptional regulator [Cyanobacteria bacterium UBA11371]HBE31741.1 XRE family transcriptional regulator [Cyanobacteria bacterium UBA11368]HBE50690.1 XRE family transcriptional regulator [Cyanobacteria bacterium UBA11369]
MNLSRELIRLRKRLGLTQKQVADAVGVTDQTVSNWEVGRFEPRLTISQMQALCRVLQCSLDELPSFTDAEKSE